MANKHQQISIGVDFIANLDKFTQGINNAKGVMSKLDFSEQTRKGIDGLAGKMATEINKIKDIASRGDVDILDLNKINTSMKHIESAYAQMINKIEDMGGDSTFLKNDAKAISKLKEGQIEYKKAIAETEKQQKKFNDALEAAQKAQKEGGKESKKKVISDSKYEELEKKRIVAENQKRAAQRKNTAAAKKVEEKISGSDGKYTSRDSKGFKNTAAYQEEKKAIEEVRRAELELQKIRKELSESTTLAKQSEEAKTLANNVDIAQKELNEFLNTQKKNATTDAFANVKKSLLEIKDIDWESAGIDLNQINNIEQLTEAAKKLDEEAISRLNAELPKLTKEMDTSDNAIRNARTEFDQMADSAQTLDDRMSQINSMKQRITYFFGLQNAAMLARRAFTSVFNTIKELDEVMTEMAVVTDFSIGDWWKQLPEYTERANEFGLAIKDVYEADTLFYQQGLKRNEVTALSNETMKMARIAGLNTADATDRMTNALRGFNMELNQTNAQNVADVYSELAAISASNVDELSVAMTKTASIASNAGASFENTAAFIAQIVETTRESAETAGTALKTVIARFTELKKDPSEIGEVDGEIVDANKIETALRSVGVALRDSNGEFRDFDDVILELSGKWDTLDVNTQRYIATIAAGSRQQSRFIALMSNNARLTQLTAAANSAAGASQKQYDKTLESLETKLNRLKNAANEFLTTIGNSDIIKGAIDLITSLIKALNWATSWGPRWIQMFTKTAAAIGLFAGLRKIVQSSLAKIGSTMGLRGAQAGTSYAQALDKTMNKGILNALDRVDAKIRNFNFKEAFTSFWKGAKIDSATLNSDLSKILNNRQNLSKEEFDNQVFEAGKNAGMTDRDAIKLVKSFEAVEKSADKLALAHDELVAKKREEIAASETVSKTQYEEAMANQNAEKTEWGEVLANKESFTTEQMEALKNTEVFTSEELEILANKEAFTSERAEILANHGVITSEEKEAIVNAASTTAESAEIAANDMATASEMAETKANIDSAISESVDNTGRSGGLLGKLRSGGARVLSFLKSFGPALLGIAIVATSVVGAVHLVDDAFYTIEERMDGVDKAVDAAAERFSQLTEELTNFNSTKDSVKSMTEELNQLKYGTAEWSAKALELNAAMSDIFTNNPELNKEEYTQTLNGIKVLNDAGWEKYQEALVDQTRTAQQTSLAIQQTQTRLQAQMNLDENGYSKAISSREQGVMTGTAGGIVGGVSGVGLLAGIGSAMASGVGFGAALGSWAGPIGAAIGVVIGGTIAAAVYSAQKDHYEQTGAAYEEAINLAAKQGFVAEGAADEEIDAFLGQLNASTEYVAEIKDLMKESASQFDETVKQQAQYNSQLAELNRQYAASLADEHGMSAGETERFQDVYDDLTEEITDYQEKILEVMRDKYDAEEEEFEYDKDLVDYYKQYAEVNGLKFNAKDKDNPFGEDFDYSQITNNSIVEFITAQKARESFEERALELLEENNQEIRTNNKSIYNQLLNQMGQESKNNDWIYDATSEQIKMMENALIQAQLRGGSSKEMGSFISKIMNAAAPDDIAAVRDILFATNWSDPLSIKALEDSLENFGIVLGENFISELTEASAALENIDIAKLTSVVETLEQFINNVAGVGVNKRVFSKEEMETAVRGGFKSSDFKEYSKDAEGNTVYVYTGNQMSAEGIQLFLQGRSLSDLQDTIGAVQYGEKGQNIGEIIGHTYNTGYATRYDLTDFTLLGTKLQNASATATGSKSYGSHLKVQETKTGAYTANRSNNYTVGAVEREYDFTKESLDKDKLLEKGFIFDNKFYQNGIAGAEQAVYEYIQKADQLAQNVESAISSSNKTFAHAITSASTEGIENALFAYEDWLKNSQGKIQENSTSSLWNMYEQIKQGVGYTTDEIKAAIKKVFVNVDFSEVSAEKFLEQAYNQYYGENGEKLKNNQLEMAQLGAENIAHFYDAQAIIDNQALIGSSTALEAVNNQFYAMDEQVAGLTNKLANFVIAAKHNQQVAYALGAEYGEAITYIDSFAEAVSNSAEALTNDVNSPAYLKATQTIAMQAKNIWGEEVNAAFVGANADLFYSISKGGNEAATAWQQIGDIILQQRMQADGLDSDIQKMINSALAQTNSYNFDEAFDATELFNSIYDQFKNKGPELMNQIRSYFLAQGIEINVELTADQTAAATATAIKTNYTGSGDNELTQDVQYWEGSYDRFYNLLNDINAELRERNKLEREFKDLTDDTPGTTQDIQKNLKAQAASLRGAIKMNEELKDGRIDEMSKLMDKNASKYSQYIGWNKGDKTLEINWNAINAQRGVGGWTEEEGAAFEEYVSQLEKYADEIYDLDETIADTNDQLEELQKTGRDEYLELEKTIYDAIVAREEALIEGMQKVSGSIDEANSDLLSGLQKSISKMRQDRQNQDTEKDISEKEQRLVYLSSSTTADPLEVMKLEEEIADARQSYTDQLIDQKISELQDQNEQAKTQREKQIAIAQAQLDYNKENGIYWEEVHNVMQKGIGLDGRITAGSALDILLKNAADWQAMSEEQQIDWKTNNDKLTALARAWESDWTKDKAVAQNSTLEEYLNKNDDDIKELTEAVKTANKQNVSSAQIASSWNTNSGGEIHNKETALAHTIARSQTGSGPSKIGEYDLTMDNVVKAFGAVSSSDIREALNYISENVDEFSEYGINSNNSGWNSNGEYKMQNLNTNASKKTGLNNYQDAYFKVIEGEDISATNSSQGQNNKQTGQKGGKKNYGTKLLALKNSNEFYGWNVDYFPEWSKDGVGKENSWDMLNFTSGQEYSIVQTVQDNSGNKYVKMTTDNETEWLSLGKVRAIFGDIEYEKIDQASFPTIPNTKEILAFKTGGLADFTGPAWLDGTKSAPEIVLNAQDTKNFLQLRDILSDLFKGGNFERSGSSGDNYYDIDINVDEISNDYDVDQLAARIKQQIVSDSMYRNVNAINFMR